MNLKQMATEGMHSIQLALMSA